MTRLRALNWRVTTAPPPSSISRAAHGYAMTSDDETVFRGIWVKSNSVSVIINSNLRTSLVWNLWRNIYAKQLDQIVLWRTGHYNLPAARSLRVIHVLNFILYIHRRQIVSLWKLLCVIVTFLAVVFAFVSLSLFSLSVSSLSVFNLSCTIWFLRRKRAGISVTHVTSYLEQSCSIFALLLVR